MRKFLTAFFCVICLNLSIFGAEFDKFLLANKDNFWTMTSEEIQKALPHSFKYHSKDKTELRYNMREVRNRLTIKKKFVISEVLITFADKKIIELDISLFNRGDYRVGLKKDAEFVSECEKFVAELGGRELNNEKRKIEKTVIESKQFADNCNDYIYIIGSSNRGVEFINLKILPKGQAKPLKEMMKTHVVKLGNLALNLERDDNGGIYLNVPMIDQGQKGYCVATTLERILKYYNADVDQHILAQIMQTEQQGTNMEVALEVLDDNRAKLRIKTRELMKEEMFSKAQDFEKFTKKYNRIAKRNDREKVEFNDYVTRAGNRKSLNVGGLFANYEYDIFREVRCESKLAVESFVRDVKKYINRGYPLGWVTWVFQNEKPGQPIGGIGGHMRIINGINEEKQLIIYTDSYGAGHEKKEMSYEDAFARTRYLILIAPSAIRTE